MSTVYLIGSAEGGLVKIGTTKDLAKRLRTLRASSPTPLDVLWQTDGDRRLEEGLHGRFAKQRKHGEWFDFEGRDPVQLVERAAKTLKAALSRQRGTQRAEASTGSLVSPLRSSRSIAVSRELLLDDRLSAAARGIGVYLAAGEEPCLPETVAGANQCSLEELRVLFGELHAAGYLITSDDGQMVFSDVPHSDLGVQ